MQLYEIYINKNGVFINARYKWKKYETMALYVIWVKVSKNGPSKISGRQPLKNLKWYGLPKQTISLQIF